MAKISSHHSLVEQNEVHHRVALVVLLQLAIQSVFQGRCIRDAGVRATGALPAEGCEYHRLLEHLGLVCERAEKKRGAIKLGARMQNQDSGNDGAGIPSVGNAVFSFR